MSNLPGALSAFLAGGNILVPLLYAVAVALQVEQYRKDRPWIRTRSRYRGTKTGRPVWKMSCEMLDETIAFPGALALNSPLVPVMQDGKLTWAPKSEVTLDMPNFNSAFSPLGNFIPSNPWSKGSVRPWPHA